MFRSKTSATNSGTVDSVMKSGWLTKKSGRLRKSNKRWIVLTGDSLTTYKSDNTKRKPTERFDLRHWHKIKVIDTTNFELWSQGDKSSRLFTAESSSDLMEWITEIGRVQKKLTLEHGKVNWICLECNFGNVTDSDKCGRCKKQRMIRFEKMGSAASLTDDEESHSHADVSEEQQHILQQLRNFGYPRDEILNAMENVSNKADINDIIEYIQEQQVLPINLSALSFDNPDDWNFLLLPMRRMDVNQQLRILYKLKKIADKMAKQDYDQYDKIYLNKSKLKYSVLVFNGGLQFLHCLGFEDHEEMQQKLVCKNINASIVKACIAALDTKIKTLLQSDGHLLSASSATSGATPMGPSPSLSNFDPFVDENDEIKDEQDNDDKDEDQLLWEEYVREHGKPKRADQFMSWARSKGKSYSFKECKNLLVKNDHVVLDMHKRDASLITMRRSKSSGSFDPPSTGKPSKHRKSTRKGTRKSTKKDDSNWIKTEPVTPTKKTEPVLITVTQKPSMSEPVSVSIHESLEEEKEPSIASMSVSSVSAAVPPPQAQATVNKTVTQSQPQPPRLKGPNKQFYNFLKQHNLEKYFDAFKKCNTFSIADIEYFDEEFLEKDIGITHRFERKKLMGECMKLKQAIDEFRAIPIAPVLREKLQKEGVITLGILCKVANHKSHLRAKFGLNDQDSDSLWELISSGTSVYSSPPPPVQSPYSSALNLVSANSLNAASMNPGYAADSEESGDGAPDLEAEGVPAPAPVNSAEGGVENAAAVDPNVVDTMHGYLLHQDEPEDIM